MLFFTLLKDVGLVVPVLLVSGAGFTKDVFNGLSVIFTSGTSCPSLSSGLPSLLNFVTGAPVPSTG